MKFELFSKLSELTSVQWILFGIFAIAFVLLLCLVLSKRKTANTQTNKFDTRALVYGAMCVSLGFVLSYIRLFHLPQGGSITLASMLPVMVYAFWYGPRRGLIAAFAYALLQFIQDPYFLNFWQFLLDYILAFGALGLAGVSRKHLLPGVILSGALRVFFHFVSGVAFFSSFATEGIGAVWYSFTYQMMTVGPDALICIFIILIPAVRNVIDRINPTLQ